ncbi:hypothetical protein CGRA01v4_12046 [Colletotrichum graminicola]|nr:hypothetical protein CGRA01v4_12046 [Colletotrichum graminicola]
MLCQANTAGVNFHCQSRSCYSSSLSLPFPAHPLGGHPSPLSCSSRPCPSSAFASTAESHTLPSGMGRLEPDDWPAVMQPAAFFSGSHWCHMYDLCPSLAARQHLLAPLGMLRT